MMAALTRSMSAATRSTKGSIDGSRALSNGTITATALISPIGRDGQKRYGCMIRSRQYCAQYPRFPTEAMRRCWRSGADKSSKKWRLLATFARVWITYLLTSIKIQTSCRHQTSRRWVLEPQINRLVLAEPPAYWTTVQ